ncbi:GMP synthase (glutamine-hydrolysing) [Balneicella halophila]|uniref:GMP synthase [glutamine-hydrolyzing] n=1 Tax=Balneicella halophila TaxID=1537566 RepID=A0A7L4URM3_BALHA|nr:glutamine-hydrolyzing GMP synthase [Balneicella halophila]PVX52425.1 GMP synthase (glutamine-hydrolysing) [Balneicella halophila]
MQKKILIIDFGSQYTQLIARRVRELEVYCEIVPYFKEIDYTDLLGIILSGSPYSVNDTDAPKVHLETIVEKVPVLGVCYGAQYLAKHYGGKVENTDKREYGRAILDTTAGAESVLFKDVLDNSQVWMSHGDTITELPPKAKRIAGSKDVMNVCFEWKDKPVYGIQFHPEVYHSTEGKKILANFLFDVCKCKPEWTSEAFAEESEKQLREKIGDDKVILGLSGGVDSTVAAMLLHRAIGKNLTCIFVDNGLLRKDEFTTVLKDYEVLGLNVIGVDASDEFLENLKGITEPEAKRKAIGNTFIDVFDREAKKIEGATWLAQGTIYPDVIESQSVNGPSKTIKSHHNVGGLPDFMTLKVVEPLRILFKDEVRRVGRSIGLPENFIKRHPFPGPGLGIRILGEVNAENVRLLQEADAIYINGLIEEGLYDEVWQAGTILLPVQSVGVMGDERTYEKAVALRAVTSTDGMTADWCHLPYEFLAKVSNQIINQVRGINRVVYDISSKPPATIEWE